ncbi:ester cyclase [Saccharopolyspora sp. NPDC050389]|uniref:ester cyclase n=1 Tax=Saccharopolyspora sp. NPDC050389 TaxID=3155516 RepID=UPI0033C95664
MSQILLTSNDKSATEELTAPVREFIAAVNAGDLPAAVNHLAADSVHHGRISNYRPEGVQVLFRLLRGVLPDLRFEIRDMRVEGDRVVSRIVGTGTHTGSYLNKPPTNRPIAWESVDIATVGRDQRGDVVILERFWDVFADARAWQEIGFIPAIMC